MRSDANKNSKTLLRESIKKRLLIPGRKSTISNKGMLIFEKGRDFRMGDRPLGRVLCVCAALLALALVSPAAEIPCVWTGIEKIVAVGDLHGDCDNFIVILKGTGLIDDNLRWSAGKTHLVQTGDIMDRGKEARRILDLLMRLEKEAEAAGGMVHVLLGNHEELNITGIVLDYQNYVTIEQFVSFLPEDFKKAREKEFISGLPDAEKVRAETGGLDLASDSVQAFWQTILKNDTVARSAYINGFNETYGKWLLQKNAVIKINDIVFAHGGLNEEYSTWKLQDINSALRTELEFFRGRMKNPQAFAKPFKPKIVYSSESPLWYRGLEYKDKRLPQKEVDRILANLKARAIVVGHGYVQSGLSSPLVSEGLGSISRYDGKVFIIDTGISSIYGGIVSALIIEDGRFFLWPPSGEMEARSPVIPPAEEAPLSPGETERFLKTAAIIRVLKGAVPGRTDPWKITLEEYGITRKALFKYIDRPRPHPIPDSYKYELAAYELAKYLGLTAVPPVVEREIEDVPGSLQVFIDNSIPEAGRKAQNLQPPDPKAFAQDMDDLKVLENLVYDSCTNDEDTLIHQEDWRVYRVDFAQAFEPNNETIQGCKILRCSRKLYQKLLEWNQDEVKALLAPFLNEEELRALHARQGLIVRMISKQIEMRGESAVLF